MSWHIVTSPWLSVCLGVVKLPKVSSGSSPASRSKYSEGKKVGDKLEDSLFLTFRTSCFVSRSALTCDDDTIIYSVCRSQSLARQRSTSIRMALTHITSKLIIEGDDKVDC